MYKTIIIFYLIKPYISTKKKYDITNVFFVLDIISLIVDRSFEIIRSVNNNSTDVLTIAIDRQFIE